MSSNVNQRVLLVTLVAVLFIGGLLGAGILLMFQTTGLSNPSDVDVKVTNQPLYWVAPMDANYRRDKPGKSPMGMDLIPVYQEELVTGDSQAGVVTISPQVVNNLGVRTGLIILQNMPEKITTVGYVQYDEDQLLHIHPRVDGWIEKLFVKAAGNPVEKGQALYTLYSPQLVNAQEELLIALKRNNQSLINAAKDRLKALQLSTDFIQQLITTGKVQHNITFYSPQSGVVAGLKIREGFYVKPGNTLLSIAKLDQVWVEAEVFERDAELIKQGLAVSMNLDYLPGKQWQGVVDYVYPSLNDKTRTLRVRLKFDNPNYQLKPNMFAQVNIDVSQEKPALLVAKEAVIRTGQQDRVVLALADGKFKSVSVVIGRVSQEYIEILAGLNQGDRVVTSAQFLIDSESSKSSDFKRLSYEAMSNKVVSDSAWLQGQLNSINADLGEEPAIINISHDAVEVWQWPEMTMDFTLADSVDIEVLEPGQELKFLVNKNAQQEYQVTEIHVISEPRDNYSDQDKVASAQVEGIIKHINVSSRIINISREAIEKWSRPATTMDFVLSEAVDISAFKQGDAVLFTFEIRDDFIITQLQRLDAKNNLLKNSVSSESESKSQPDFKSHFSQHQSPQQHLHQH